MTGPENGVLVGFDPNTARRRGRPLDVLDPLAWHDQPIPERPWLVKGLIPRRVVTMLGGDGGLGKSLLAGNENRRPHARQFINALRDIAIATDGAVIVTAHPSLSGRASGTGEAGSTAWHNAVRSRLYLKSEDGEDDDIRVLKTMKANYGRRGKEMRLKWIDGVFINIGVLESRPTRIADDAA